MHRCACGGEHHTRIYTTHTRMYMAHSQVKEGGRRLEELLETRNEQRSAQQQHALSANLVPGLQQQVARKNAEIQQLSERAQELDLKLSEAQTMAEYFSRQLEGDRAASEREMQAHVVQVSDSQRRQAAAETALQHLVFALMGDQGGSGQVGEAGGEITGCDTGFEMMLQRIPDMCLKVCGELRTGVLGGWVSWGREGGGEKEREKERERESFKWGSNSRPLAPPSLPPSLGARTTRRGRRFVLQNVFSYYRMCSLGARTTRRGTTGA